MTLTGHKREVYSAAYSPDGQRVVTAGYGDKTAKVWEAQTGTEQVTLTGLNDQVMSDTYSPDGKRIASVGGGGRQLTAGEKERYGILD